jgi:hypothetical protein
MMKSESLQFVVPVDEIHQLAVKDLDVDLSLCVD